MATRVEAKIAAQDAALKIAAVTLADAIRERLITYTPVTNAHQALILAYTIRMYKALEEVGQVDYSDVTENINAALEDAIDKGFSVPSLPL